MDIAGEKPSQDGLQNLLLQYKYYAAVRRVTRGVAHSYNNIFTGLGGQTALLQQETSLLGDASVKRGELIGDLLRRGIEQTAILSGFARDADADSRSHSPLGPATKAVELLNCISRVHRFQLVSKVRQERLVCNLRDIVLLLFYLGENCVDATPDGGEVVLEICRQEAEAGQNPTGLVFRFLDHGPGFTENILTSLNDPFIKNISEFPGRGLGLYAARILAERHHGLLTIARTEENRTVVGAAFPVAVEETRAEVHIENTEKENRRQSELSKQCFLVVEDDEAMRTLLLNRLQRRGHMVFCVDTCTEGLEEYAQLHDIITTILMDVGLRDTSGYECYRKMLAVNPQARIIFMSGQDDMIPAAIAGNTVFLQKPFTLDQLETAVCDVHL
jgi:two-component system, cell cycle sensor histidine kinase and response regulator CckA